LYSSDPNPSLDKLRRESADILIVPGMLLGEHFVEHHRWSDHYVLAVARNKHGAGRSVPELLSTNRYVAWRHAGVERLHARLGAAQLRLSHRGELSCIDTLLDLVAKGHCLSIVPSRLLTGHLKEIDPLPLPVGILRQISVVARPASLISNAANVVLQTLRKPALKAVQGY
jgi:DNA-binding transcriptional LysR family regulator